MLIGDEYSYILNNINLYEKELGFKCYPSKTHPLETYLNPQSNFSTDAI